MDRSGVTHAKAWLSIESLPNGSAQCAADRKAVQNRRTHAVNQNQMAWFSEVMPNEETANRVIHKYKVRLAAVGGEPKMVKSYSLVYQEEVRQEKQLLLDAVSEMMTLPAYCE